MLPENIQVNRILFQMQNINFFAKNVKINIFISKK